MHTKRYVQLITVFGIGLLSLLISLGNITDYWTNFEFVKHVLMMDTIFPDSTIKYRSITSPILHHIAYIIIILMEAMMSVLLLSSTFSMYKAIHLNEPLFKKAKKNAFIGITIGIALWFIGFEVIGGEWFGMWQSTTWNGLSSANRIVLVFGLCYMMLSLEVEKKEDY